MAVKLICASHSPLMEFATPRDAAQEQTVRDTFAQLAKEVEAYDPTLMIVFGPDHFNGFFYDLMPSFCVGIRASAAGDWDYGPGDLNVPETTAQNLVHYTLEAGVDVAFSYRMQADHGITQPLHFLCQGKLDRYPVIPIFINSSAAPLPTIARTIALGKTVGQFLTTLNLNKERVLILGTGGLSHDPPTPQIGAVPPEVEAFLIGGRNPTPEARSARQQKVIDVGQKLSMGDETVSVPLNADWDRQLLALFAAADFKTLSAMTAAEIGEQGGRGGQEIRCWIAALAALATLGDYTLTTHCYEAISEWIAGFSIISAELQDKERYQ